MQDQVTSIESGAAGDSRYGPDEMSTGGTTKFTPESSSFDANNGFRLMFDGATPTRTRVRQGQQDQWNRRKACNDTGAGNTSRNSSNVEIETASCAEGNKSVSQPV